MNPGHPRGQQAEAALPGGRLASARVASPGATPYARQPARDVGESPRPNHSIAASPEKRKEREEKRSSREPVRTIEADSSSDRVSPLKTAAFIAGILVLAGGVLFASAEASALFRRPSGEAAGGKQSALAMPRPSSCAGDSIWGVRRITTGESYWSCTTRDGKNVRFYDAPAADLAQQTTLRCPSEGTEGSRKYVDCVKIDKKR